MRYSLLSEINTRRKFDPSNGQDLMELKHFIETNQWIDICPFYLEDDWDNIPAMCMYKYTRHMLLDKKSKKAKSPK